jgi:hypothetical protein|tara:strand:+ start:1003 stop:1308 length:306 start_codon:yes stop_codon:yes gene_type:complete
MITTQALLSLRPNSQFDLRTTEGVQVLTWNDKEQTEPTQVEIDTEIIRLQAEFDAQEYARNRKPEYPDIGDQLDDLYHKGAFSDEMAVKIKAVKDAHPKPE